MKESEIRQWFSKLGFSESALNAIIRKGLKVSITLELPDQESEAGDEWKAS